MGAYTIAAPGPRAHLRRITLEPGVEEVIGKIGRAPQSEQNRGMRKKREVRNV